MIKYVREGTRGHYLAILRGFGALETRRDLQRLGYLNFDQNKVKIHDFEWIFEVFGPKTYDIMVN